VDLNTLQNQLADLPLGQVAYFRVVGSTNSEAMRWIEGGVPHLSLVAADEQTAGRGRSDRTWQTVPGAALAFSLVIRPPENGMISASRLTGLGALAVCDVLRSDYGLPAKIKWPNDVLCGGKKLAGVLVEAQWQADDIQSAVMISNLQYWGLASMLHENLCLRRESWISQQRVWRTFLGARSIAGNC